MATLLRRVFHPKCGKTVLRLTPDGCEGPVELYTADDRQRVMAIEITSAFFGGLGELEDHHAKRPG
jgi:hypothetical protein